MLITNIRYNCIFSKHVQMLCLFLVQVPYRITPTLRHSHFIALFKFFQIL
jgi:hypothetical protein